MSEWHTHYPVQAGAARGQLITTRDKPGDADSACRATVVCEACGDLMEAGEVGGDSAARAAAERLLVAHAPQCRGAQA